LWYEKSWDAFSLQFDDHPHLNRTPLCMMVQKCNHQRICLLLCLPLPCATDYGFGCIYGIVWVASYYMNLMLARFSSAGISISLGGCW
jgi:hypothetical protein